MQQNQEEAILKYSDQIDISEIWIFDLGIALKPEVVLWGPG